MRVVLTKATSTKGERKFAALLTKHKIPFTHRAKLEGHEIDFIVGKYAIEIDGHEQETARNKWLIDSGFVPLHYSNRMLRDDERSVEQAIIMRFKQ